MPIPESVLPKDHDEDKDAIRCEQVTTVCNALIKAQMKCNSGKCDLAKCREAHLKYDELEKK